MLHSETGRAERGSQVVFEFYPGLNVAPGMFDLGYQATGVQT